MARIRIRTEDQLEWRQSEAEDGGDYDRDMLGEAELTTQFRIREMGSDTAPQLIELRYEPHAEIQLHAHDEDEIIFILSGMMHLGPRTVPPGTSLYVAGGTLYTFRAGAEGLQILNFRPRKDLTFHTPGTLAALKARQRDLATAKSA